MGFRLSGRLVACLHAIALAVICAVFAKNGVGFWPPVLLYLFGAGLLWVTSLPGMTSGAGRDTVINRKLARGVARHGFDHGGYRRRRDWDWSGLNSRILLHLACLLFAGLPLLVARGENLLLILLAGAALSLGVEGGFAAFSAGDEAVLRRHRRPVVAPDNDE